MDMILVISFVLLWEIVRIISLGSGFVADKAMQKIQGFVCVAEIETTLTNSLLIMSVFIIQDFMLQIYLVARSEQNYKMRRIIYLISVCAAVSVLQSSVIIKQCTKQVTIAYLYWVEVSIGAYFSVVNVFIVLYVSKALSDKMGSRVDSTISRIKYIGLIVQFVICFFMIQQALLAAWPNMGNQLELLLFVIRLIFTELAPFALFNYAIKTEIIRLSRELDNSQAPLLHDQETYSKGTSPDVSAEEDEYRNSKGTSSLKTLRNSNSKVSPSFNPLLLGVKNADSHAF